MTIAPTAAAVNFYSKMSTADLAYRADRYFYQQTIHGGLNGSQRSCARAIIAAIAARNPGELGAIECWDERSDTRNARAAAARLSAAM